MNSLEELNNYNNDFNLEYTDYRDIGVVFDRPFPVNQPTQITSTSFYPTRGIEILDVVGGAAANVQVSLYVFSAGSPPLSGISYSFPTLPSGVHTSLDGLGGVVITGIKNRNHWQTAMSFMLTLPIDYELTPIWFLRVSIRYYDGASNSTKALSYEVFDPEQYYTATLFSQSDITCVPKKIVGISEDLQVESTLFCETRAYALDMTTSMTCSALKVKLGSAALSVQLNSSINVVRIPAPPGAGLKVYATLNCTPVPDIATFKVYVDMSTNSKIAYVWVKPNASGASISWGDGTSTNITYNGNFQQYTHTYSSTGYKLIRIINDTKIDAVTVRDRDQVNPAKLTQVRYWGYPAWKLAGNTLSFTVPPYRPRAFCDIISSATNISTTITSSFFGECPNFNDSNVSMWDMIGITSIAGMFFYCENFNQPLSNWNTSSVTDMSQLFYGAYKFNQPLYYWNTSNVTTMEFMFSTYRTFPETYGDFNQDISQWDTSKVTNMASMFEGCRYFNQDISRWNTSKVTTMNGMFSRCYSFNQPLNSWNTSLVTDMLGMFGYNLVFNQNISTWNTSKVTTMAGMFTGCDNFNQPLNNWNTSLVTNMEAMFSGCDNFNQPLNNWNTGNVTNMQYMFSQCTNFNQALNTWNTSKVTNMQYMFRSAINFNQPLNNWDTGLVTNMQYMFSGFFGFNDSGIMAFNQNISSWDVHLIPSKPTDFDAYTLATWTIDEKPIWGTTGA